MKECKHEYFAVILVQICDVCLFLNNSLTKYYLIHLDISLSAKNNSSFSNNKNRQVGLAFPYV